MERDLVESRVTPSRWAYATPVAIAVVGALLFSLLVMNDLSTMTEALIQITVPGQKVLTLSQAGSYTVFHEFQSIVGDTVISSVGIALNLNCKVVSEKTAEEVPLTQPTSSASYTFNGRSGSSVLEFQIAEPGQYTFSCANTEAGDSKVIAVFAIGHEFGATLMKTVFTGLLTAFGSAGIAVFMALAIRRKRRAAHAALAAKPIDPYSSNIPLG